jgi:DNA modification methylase
MSKKQENQKGGVDHTVVWRPIDDLNPFENNPRTHSDEQVEQIARSLDEFGWTYPILLNDDDTIIAGHGRLLAAHKRGFDKVPTITAKGWSEAQQRAYVIADNRLAENAGWDMPKLKVEMNALAGFDFDLALTGFDMGRVSFLTKPDAEGDPEEVPEPPAKPKTKAGDIWQLGEHRLICGDSTDAATVAALLEGSTPHLMVTDPPYGVEYDPTRTSDNKQKAGKVLNDDRADWREAWALFPGDVAYVWHASMFTDVVIASLEEGGFERRAMVIWAKDRMTLGRGHYHWQHEPAWYVVRKGSKGHWSGDRSQTTIWNIKAREDKGHGHGTQKPVECMRRPILNNSQPGDAVYDPFLGSGTTLIACEMEGRVCYGAELSPAYCDVIVARWENYTGRKATRAKAKVLA